MSPNIFAKSNQNKIQALLEVISAHTIEAINPKTNNQSRKALDQYWFHLLGIKEDCLDDLYQNVTSLIGKRLARADNF